MSVDNDVMINCRQTGSRGIVSVLMLWRRWYGIIIQSRRVDVSAW